MINQIVAMLFSNSLLNCLDFAVLEFNHGTGHRTDHMVVVIAAIQLVHRGTIVKVVSDYQPSALKLRQHAIHRGNAHVFFRVAQTPIDILGGHVQI